MTDALRPTWPLIAFLASAALLAGAHAFETFGHMAPCVMCLQQREVHWWILGFAALCFAILRFRPSLARPIAVLIGAGFLISLFFAARHVAVEHHWLPAQCETTSHLNANDLRFDVHATFSAPRCDVPAWSMFGVTMAGYNGLISLALAALSFLVALAPSRKDANG